MYTNTQWLNFMLFVLIGLYIFLIPHTIFHNDFITIPLLVCMASLFSTYLLAFVSVVFYYCYLSKVGLWLVSHSLMITEILFYALIWLFICLEILRNIYFLAILQLDIFLLQLGLLHILDLIHLLEKLFAHTNRKGRNKIIPICRHYNSIYNKLKRVHQEAFRMNDPSAKQQDTK